MEHKIIEVLNQEQANRVWESVEKENARLAVEDTAWIDGYTGQNENSVAAAAERYMELLDKNEEVSQIKHRLLIQAMEESGMTRKE